ncbi:hypothetical protein PF007_g27641 [Phytophthora fragariae]|uniref:SWIM-type domain-containing protein n=1 Tax=Phytophthora fragariae TaxID=53985 RepID=A0A6A3Q3V0_9STRA|nr:hypothetical protein PF007_g27641 [Phytophthora fragariae]
MALDECVDTLMFLQAVAEMQYAKKITDVGQMRYNGADEELDKLAREVSAFAYRLVEQQYWLSKDRKTHYELKEIHSSLFVLTSGDDAATTYHVDTSRYRCSCVFMKTMLLPCRHVMYWRLMQGKSAIPLRYIEPRWKLSCKLNQPVTEEEVADLDIACTKFQIRESAMAGRDYRVLNGSTKYNHALERGRSIADIMSRNGTSVFREMMNALERFEDIVKDGVAPLVGREGHWMDPLSLTQLSQFDLTPTTEVVVKSSETTKVSSDTKHETEHDSGDDPPLTQRSPVNPCSSVTPATLQVPPTTHQVPAGTARVTPVTSGVPPVPSEVPPGTLGVPPASTYQQQFIRIVAVIPARVRLDEKQRIKRGKQTAAKLVQGTLAPVPSVQNIVTLLDEDYTYEDAHRALPAISIRDVPKTKKAIAGSYTSEECNDDVRFVFPERFVAKAQSSIMTFRKTLLTKGEGAEDSVGVRVPRFGIFHHKDIVAMNRWHTCMGYLAETEVAINWASNTSIKRIGIPDELSDGVNEVGERENAIRQLLLRGGRSTPFGEVPYRSLLTFREDVWMDDNTMCHGLALLQRENSNVGVINPICMRFKEQDVKLKVATAGNPFRETNDMVLLPLHIDETIGAGLCSTFAATAVESRFSIHCKRQSQSIAMRAKHS